jgi:hypothetical protein
VIEGAIKMANGYTEEVKSQLTGHQGIQDDLDRWRDESPAAGRVSDLNEERVKTAVDKGLKAVAEYRSEIEDRVRRFPGSSVLMAGAIGVLAGLALTRCFETTGFWRGAGFRRSR